MCNNLYKNFIDEHTDLKEFWNNGENNDVTNFFLCPPRGNLYHYTSATALASILQNKEFWITKANFMNDVSEIKYACNLFLSRLKNSTIPDEKKNNLIDEFTKSIESGLFDNIYVLSLSANGDSLPMWSYYGKSDGYNIGISSNFISDFANHKIMKMKVLTNNDPVEKNIGFCVDLTKKKEVTVGQVVKANYILYDKEKQTKIFDIYINKINELIKKNDNSKINLLMSDILSYIPYMKDSSYANEEEYRVLVQLSSPSQDSKLELDKLQYYRVFNGSLIPFIKLSFKDPSYIISVTNSPFNQSELTELGLEDLVNSYPTKLNRIKSNIPSRF